ncbi:KGGVGR-motif variant AAA ATPase [Streptomyces sp. NPDC056716]|uniref:nSTAND1 domain-containing NTPase n=1 Tax=unclassified Streptomyces TaxID=2593676 RepID=UPI0036BA70D0
MIVTFYSYKGGVGRSMALANIADQLARSGMRVLMVDFDLEAPGLEHFFPIPHERVREREGLLDLLLAYKYAMSMAAPESAGAEEDDAFRDLDRYLCTVYPRRSDGGRLDLLPAGRRLTDEQINRYGAELRRFDWQDFYFVWSGELFFEWFRRTCAERYDIVLVDSRTGVTELGGVCAYQLADTIVTLCAPNLQNVDGTAWMVRHFLSPQVREVRGDRPLEVLVVPARVDQNDTALLDTFAERFRHAFDPYAPGALTRSGLAFWDLQIPYEPAYAFDEQVITDPRRSTERRGLADAYAHLRTAITLLAPDTSPLAALRPATMADGLRGTEPVETRYDPTTRFASPDVFLSYLPADQKTADQLRERLTKESRLQVADLRPGQPLEEIHRARLALVLIGPGGPSRWQLREIEALTARDDSVVLPVLLPGAEQPPEQLRRYNFIDLRTGATPPQLVKTARAALRLVETNRPEPPQEPLSPYPGLAAFSEVDAPVFFGREALVDLVLSTLDRYGMCTITGGAGSGKTSLVHAGVVPALRTGRLPGSHLWPIVVRHSCADGTELLETLRELPVAERVVLVLDRFEELFTSVETGLRHRVITWLRTLSKEGGVLPIAVLRTDLLFPLDVDVDGGFLAAATVAVGPMTEHEMRQAMELPARTAGLQPEPGLTDRLVADLGEGPGVLAILQTTLHALWTRRQDGYLTHQAYAEWEGADGSLARIAEGLFQSLTDEEKTHARTLLLHLVSLDSDGRHRPQLLSMAEVAELGATAVCERMVRGRLLSTTTDAHNTPSVQFAHAALVEAWPRLQIWIAPVSAALQLRQRLSAAARQWDQSGQAPVGLLGEEPLASVHAMLAESPITLAGVESRYLKASETDLTRRRRVRRLARLNIACSLLGVGFLLLSMVWSDSASWSPAAIVTLVAAFSGVAGSGVTLFFARRHERRSLTP